MLQDYKHLVSGRKTRKPHKSFILRTLIAATLLALLTWLFTSSRENSKTLQFSFYGPEKIHYDFSNFATKDRLSLRQTLTKRFNAETITAVNHYAIVIDNKPKDLALNQNEIKPEEKTRETTGIDANSPDVKTVSQPDIKTASHPDINVTSNSETTSSSPDNNNNVTKIYYNWHSVIIEPGHTLNQMGVELKLSQKDMGRLLLAAKKHRRKLILNPGREIRFQLEHPSRKLITISYSTKTNKRFVLTRTRRGFSAHTYPLKLDIKFARVSAIINTSLFDATSKTTIPDSLILQLTTLFNWDIDFISDLNKGDRFTILYERYKGQGNTTYGDIVAASITLKGKPRFAFRYTNPNGHTAWYNQNAELLKRRFLRTPLRMTRDYHKSDAVRSIKTNNAAIRYSAPEGTPVKTTANGTIIFVGNKRRLGKTVIIRHRKGYSTLYAHLSRFRKRLRPGRRVSQGQVIAYVGKTGTADNAQLHYELRLRGKHLNPLASKNFRRKKITKRWRKDFMKKTVLLQKKLKGQ